MKTSFVVVFAVVFLFHSSGQVLHHIAAANIAVVQNDTNNTSASVTVSTALSINDFRIRTGSNRGDYDVQVGPVSADDVTNGILMTSIRQNGRDNGEAKYPGMNYGTCGVDSSGTPPGASGEWFIPLFQAPTGDEYNFNVAAAWFPYSDGWYGGWLNNASGANGGANNHLIGTPGLVLGTHVVDQGSGKTKVDLRAFGLDSRSNAVLLVEGGKNESNFALSTTNSDGTWTVYCHDDDVSGGSYEQDYVGFVCVPLTNHTVVSGKFLGDNTVLMSSQTYNVSNPGLGAYHLSIPGVDPNTGVLIISAEGAGSLNLDNIVSYEVNGDGWDIQTRDLNPGYTPLVQNLDVSNAVVSFVFVPGPAASTRLLWSGNSSTNWDYSANQVWRLASNGALTNYSDAAQIVFDDSASNTIVNVATTVTPYQVTVSNASRAYVMGGSGKVSGGASFTKLGGAKLTLAVANSYTGDTTISQGTAAQGTNNSVPGGGGFGDTTIMGTFDLAGFDCTINNFSGHGVVDNTAAGKSPRLTAYQTATTTYGGILKNTSGSLAFGVSGGGKLTLTGANTFGGGVIISDGTLLVNGSLGAGPVSVLSGGQFGGTGSTLASVSITNNGALLLTANSPLTTGPISLNGTATINISGAGSLTTAGTYALLNHGAVSGGGSFKLGPIPGLQPNGLAAKLWDTGSQLQLILTVAGVTGTIADVRHVVILMDENRAFDHYYGSHYGVRGFGDRNALMFTNGNTDFYQPSGASYELPFHTTVQCLTDLNHTWPVTHATVNNGLNNAWIANKGAETMCYFQRADLPYFYALADSFTICDEYHCSVLSSTDPNRCTLMTGMIDPHGTGGGPETDNTALPSGFTWKTYPEFLQDAGVSWKVYLVSGNSADNVLPRFAAFKQATAGNPLYDRGRAGYSSMAALTAGFASDVANNTLPAVSWVIGPGPYTEHPPDSPANGEVFLKLILDGLSANPQVYKSTVFVLNYDENDGFYDHAMPILPPPGTPDEFVGSLPIGLGIRVPCIIVSPWTRGGRVCSQIFDHTSVTRFLETWTGVVNTNISAWRRQVCGDMTSAFDFAHPNTSFPSLPTSVSEISCPSGTTPSVPSPQTFPVQESGIMTPMPLPYQPNVLCAISTAQSSFTMTMTNTGAASVHFGLYANAYRTDGPWPCDVDTATSATATFSTATTAGKYDFTCYAPNGFQRRFAGSITNDFQKIEAFSILNFVNRGLQIALANMSTGPVTFAVTNGYMVGGLSPYVIPAHTTNIVNIGSETNNGFYDVTVTSTTDALFVRRFLGRVEAYVAPAFVPGSLVTNGLFQFSFSGPAAQPYRVLATTNLANSAWAVVASGAFTGEPIIYTETNMPAPSERFYRLASP